MAYYSLLHDVHEIAYDLRGHRLTPLDSLYYAGYSTAELLHYWYVIRFGDILIFPCKQN